jgi:dipeptidyl aminopeptidase/acylaminoacyl peptidase
LFLDFAGRGDSAGKTITMGAGEASDLEAAVDFLSGKAGVDSRRIALAGRGMGAVAAILAAGRDRRVRALVLDSPYADLGRVADENLSARYVPAALVRPPLFAVAAIRARFDPYEVRPIDAIGGVETPILLLHGEEDRKVRFRHAEEFAAAAGDDLELVPLTGLDHDSERPPEYAERIASFLEAAL